MEEDRYYAYGVVNFGRNCHNTPGVYARVSHYSDWIWETIHRSDNENTILTEKLQMAKSVIKSKLDKATEHAQRVDDWNNRMKDFYENTAKMDRFLADLHFVKLKNVNDSMPSLMREHGFKLESNVEDNRLPGSLSSGNTTYCKLVKYRWKGNKVICRQYCFSPSVSREMMRTIGEGTRLMSYFGSRRKSAPYFLEVHKVFYNAP
ncbi:Scrasp1p [Tyrophagus putrescentiae]|nr:Scrasp1p [Tyrophagus putrescentiae]